jgi:alkylhydroperoxidase family enzyme
MWRFRETEAASTTGSSMAPGDERRVARADLASRLDREIVCGLAPVSPMSRLDGRTQSELPDDYRYLLSEDAMGEINLLTVMANNPDALRAYMRYGSALWEDCGLEAADVERVILVVARELDSAYEWHQHLPVAREQGVAEAELAAIAGNCLDDLDDRRAAIFEYARAVVADDVDDAVFAAAAEVLDDSTLVGATLLATHYLATQRFLEALSVPIEADKTFVGWSVDG